MLFLLLLLRFDSAARTVLRHSIERFQFFPELFGLEPHFVWFLELQGSFKDIKFFVVVRGRCLLSFGR